MSFFTKYCHKTLTLQYFDFYNMGGHKKEIIMEQKIWAKTLLSGYNCLEKMADAIDLAIISQGIGSSKNHLTTMENAEKIIDLIQRKKTLVNLKVMIENVMANIDVNSARLLVLKYFDRVKTELCLEILSLTRRTFFRRVDRALDEFACKLKHLGYDDNTLCSMLAKEYWIKEIYNALASNNVVDEQSSDYEYTLKVKMKHAMA